MLCFVHLSPCMHERVSGDSMRTAPEPGSSDGFVLHAQVYLRDNPFCGRRHHFWEGKEHTLYSRRFIEQYTIYR